MFLNLAFMIHPETGLKFCIENRSEAHSDAHLSSAVSSTQQRSLKPVKPSLSDTWGSFLQLLHRCLLLKE